MTLSSRGLGGGATGPWRLLPLLVVILSYTGITPVSSRVPSLSFQQGPGAGAA